MENGYISASLASYTSTNPFFECFEKYSKILFAVKTIFMEDNISHLRAYNITYNEYIIWPQDVCARSLALQ